MRLVNYLALLLAIVAMVISIAACSDTSGTSAHNGGATATNTATTTGGTGNAPTPTSTSEAPSTYEVNVYFSKHPDSDNNVNAVFSVQRTSPDLHVATYAIQQLILGPTASEQAGGYYTPLTTALSGASNCGGADFQITLNMKGTMPELGTTTLKFCRTVQLAGDLTGGRISAEIIASLKQFSSITKIIILTSDGGCFDDLSGQNLCLK